MLTQQQERSKSLIAAVLMILYSSVTLAVLNSLDLVQDWYHSSEYTPAQKTFIVLCDELPFMLVFMAHWIIFY